jgi:glycosyltransferase involved in cell wall biosynthesis
MRVLYLSPSAELGGAERALLEGIRALRSLEPSWTIGLFCLEDGPLVGEARSLGVDATVLPVPEAFAATGESGRNPAVTLLQLTRGAGPIAGYARSFRKAVLSWAPDIVHSNGIKTHLLGAWSHGAAPLVWHVHDFLSTRGVSATLLRRHRRTAALVIANSRAVAEDVERVLGASVRIETIHNGVDTERFRPDGPAVDLDTLSGLDAATPAAIRIGLVATYARWKGHHVFLRSLAGLFANRAIGRHDVPFVRAYIVGGPVYRTGSASQVTREELEGTLTSLGLNGRVGLTGFVNDTAPIYRSLDIVVHASTSPEPFGLSVAEAMACGRAVIVSDAGGTKEIGEHDRTCLVHRPGDVPALTEALSRLIRDSSLRERLGRSATAAIRSRFTSQRFGESLGAAYKQIAAPLCRV